MNSQQIELVRRTFTLVEPIAAQAAELFYDNLFEADPQMRQLFTADMSRQGERLMSMIGAAVGLLGRPAQLTPVLHALGARHAGYRVQPVHYERVGAALLKTLGQGLGGAFTPEVRASWAAFYGLVSREMLAGAREPAISA